MKTILLVAGARPNFMKLAPLVRALDRRTDQVAYRIVHTGQHYDREMSDVFFDELGIPQPHFHLGAGGGSHAEQTARIMVAFEALCREQQPAAVVVFGDVNSTLACSVVAKKAGILVAHVEAGLRSGDWAMPEEVNRVVTDSITDLFFVTEPSGLEHLRREGKPEAALFHVGHVMADNVLFQRERLRALPVAESEATAFKRAHDRYGVVTLHRPSNVDDEATFRGLGRALAQISARLPLIFPVHPRTRGNLQRFGIELGAGVSLTAPLAYNDFLNLWMDAALVLTDSGGLQEETTVLAAALVLTDSGGLQEETTVLGVPCLTLRENTERPVTVTDGTNLLVGVDPEKIVAAAEAVLSGGGKRGMRPALWDGQAAERIADVLVRRLAA